MADTGDQPEELRRLRHDLRGAFNELRLCVEVLRVETDSERAVEWLESIESAAERCAALVRQLQALR
jgi:signal transduction histidine kinase